MDLIINPRKVEKKGGWHRIDEKGTDREKDQCSTEGLKVSKKNSLSTLSQVPFFWQRRSNEKMIIVSEGYKGEYEVIYLNSTYEYE